MKLICATCVLLSALVLSTSTVPLIIIDQPYNNTPVGRTFTMHGTAINADAVHVWAFPATGPVFVGAAYPSQVDTSRQLATGRWSVLAQDLPVGTYPVVAYAHDPVAGNFPSQHGITLEVRTCVPYTMTWLLYGPTGLTDFMRPYCAAA